MLLAVAFSGKTELCSISICPFSVTTVTLKFFYEIPEGLMVLGKFLSSILSAFNGKAIENEFSPPGVRARLKVSNVTWLLVSLLLSSSSLYSGL
jgi:hypothetical protein